MNLISETKRNFLSPPASSTEEIVNSFAAYIRSISYKYPDCAYISRDDLYSAGVAGLLEAIKKYDPTRFPDEVYFRAFAVKKINFAIKSEIRKCDTRSSKTRMGVKKLKLAQESFFARHKEEPTFQQLVVETGFSEQRLKFILSNIKPHKILSLCERVGARNSDKDELGDIIADENNSDIDQALDRYDLECFEKNISGCSSSRDMMIYRLHFREYKDLSEIAKMLNLTHIRICQIIRDFKNKLTEYFSYCSV